MESTLLQGGTVLVHDSQDHVTAVITDILIKGNTITKMSKNIPHVSSPTRIIDCRNKIISPGFIDTHHHLWQTQLKGRHGDDSLLDYMPKGGMVAHVFSSSDIFWGQLGGALEAIDAGTTTVVDHAHMNYSEEHNASAISASSSSGLRTIFCYTFGSRVKSLKPTLSWKSELLPAWQTNQFTNLLKSQPFGNGRVNLGLATDSVSSLPKADVLSLFAEARKGGIKLITSHYVPAANLYGQSSIIKRLSDYGILEKDILISHATGASKEDAQLLAAANAHISSTPSTELQMAMGKPECFRSDLTALASLGVDCHSSAAGSILEQARLALASERGFQNQKILNGNQVPAKIHPTIEEAFNLATIKGARAIGMESTIGSLAVGKRADLVIFDALSPATVCGGQENALATVLLHASVRDMEMVMIDGIVRKENGKLVPVALQEGYAGREKGQLLQWSEVAAALVESRRRIQESMASLDFARVGEDAMTASGFDRDRLV